MGQWGQHKPTTSSLSSPRGTTFDQPWLEIFKPRGTGRPNCTKDQEEDPCQVKVTGPAEAVSWPVIADPDVPGGIVSFRTLRPYSVAIFP